MNRKAAYPVLDNKIRSLLTVVRMGSYTKAAQELHLTQPAVSHHIRLLEEEFGIKIFKPDKKELLTTEEGAILIKYARRMMAIEHNTRQALEDNRRQAKHLSIGITQTAGENLMPQVMAIYCNEHPDIHINIFTDTIKKLYEKLEMYELDMAIVEGILPNSKFSSVLLDTDYLCLIVSPGHRFAKRKSVLLSELKEEKLILRPGSAGTRILFDNYLLNHGESIRNFNVMMELDNIAMIKDLVCLNMGISIIAKSACKEEEKAGKLIIVPIENANMTREINMVYHKDFAHTDLLEQFRRIYNHLY